MYQAHFNFAMKPFSLSPDVRFFYASKTHKNALAYLEYGLDQHEGFLVLTGDPGTGKTTLINKLEESLSRLFIVAKIDASPGLTNKELLKLITAALGVQRLAETDESVDLSLAIKSFLSKQFQQNCRVIIFVDECHHLSYESLEELRLLSNIVHRGTQLLQCFLVGQTSFRETMKSPELDQLRQRVVAVCHLQALNDQETGEYIRHRLQKAGNNGRDVFAQDAIRIIHDFTTGIPRRINRICDRALLFASIEDRHYIDVDMICEVIEELSAEMEVAFDASHYRSDQQNETYYPMRVRGGDVVPIFAGHQSISQVKPACSEIKKSSRLYVLIDSDQNTGRRNRKQTIDEEIPVLTIDAYSETVTSAADDREKPNTDWLRTGGISLITIIIVSLSSLLFLEVMFNRDNDSRQTNDPSRLVELVLLDKVSEDVEITDQEIAEPIAVNNISNAFVEMKGETVNEAIAETNFETVLPIATNPDQPQTLTNPVSEESSLAVFEEDTKEELETRELVVKKPIEEVELPVQVFEEKPELRKVTLDVKSKQESVHKKTIPIVKPTVTKKIVAMAPEKTPVIRIKENIAKQIVKSQVEKTVAAAVVEKNVLPMTELPVSNSETPKIILEYIANKELNTVVTDFLQAYKLGSVDKLARVLSENIKTNDSDSLSKLTESYRKLFDITQQRELRLTNMMWDKNQNIAKGKGRFEATILEQGRSKPRVFRGSIAMNVEKNDIALAITEMYYQYE